MSGCHPRPYDLPQVNIYSTTDAAELIGRYEISSHRIALYPGTIAYFLRTEGSEASVMKCIRRLTQVVLVADLQILPR